LDSLANIFSIYFSPVYHTAQLFTISHLQYADEAFFCTSLSPPQNRILAYNSSSNIYSLSAHSFQQTAFHLMASKYSLSSQRLRNFPSDKQVDVAVCNISVTDSLLTLGISLQ
jgi:hypothetical protein